MAITLSTAINLDISVIYRSTGDLSDTENPLILNIADKLSSGTGKDNADRAYSATRSLAAESEDLDLSGGLTDVFGASLVFVKIKLIYIRNRSTTAGETLTVGGAATNQFINWVGDATDKHVIGPNGIFFAFNPSLAGWAVTAGTGDLLKIDSGAATLSFDIVLVGTSA